MVCITLSSSSASTVRALLVRVLHQYVKVFADVAERPEHQLLNQLALALERLEVQLNWADSAIRRVVELLVQRPRLSLVLSVKTASLLVYSWNGVRAARPSCSG
jgi:hypothetical protein